MIEVSKGQTLRIRCDAEGCERLFSPRRPLPPDPAAAIVTLAERAELQGWQVRDPLRRIDADLCPGDKP